MKGQTNTVIFVPNTDHCLKRTVHSFINSNFNDFHFFYMDFMHNQLKTFYRNADTRSNKLNKLRLFIEVTNNDTDVIAEAKR